MRYLSCCIAVNDFTHGSSFMSRHSQSASNVRLFMRLKVGSSCMVSQPAMRRVSSEVSLAQIPGNVSTCLTCPSIRYRKFNSPRLAGSLCKESQSVSDWRAVITDIGSSSNPQQFSMWRVSRDVKVTIEEGKVRRDSKFMSVRDCRQCRDPSASGNWIVTTGMKNNIFDSRRRSIYSNNNSTLPLMMQLQSEPRSRIKLFERHCHRSKLNSWYWQNGYIPDTGKVSGFWMSFVPGTHFYRQKTKYTKPAAKPVPTTSPKNSFRRLYTLKGLLVLVEKASFSKEFRSEFYSGGGGNSISNKFSLCSHNIWE